MVLMTYLVYNLAGQYVLRIFYDPIYMRLAGNASQEQPTGDVSSYHLMSTGQPEALSVLWIFLEYTICLLFLSNVR